MLDRRFLSNTLSLSLTLAVVSGCQSQSNETAMETSMATVPPPVMNQQDDTSVAQSGEVTTSADEIAARARRDLLESISLDSETSEQGNRSLSASPVEEIITWEGVSTADRKVPTPPSAASQTWTPEVQPEIETPDIEALCNQLAQALYERSQQGNGQLRDLTVLAALALLDRDRALQATAMESLSAEQRIALESIQNLFLAMEGRLDDEQAVLVNLSEAAMGFQASLRKAPEFGLMNTSLATRVGGYGDIDEWKLRSEADDYNFIAHSSQEVILYLELEGFDSRMDGDGQWSTSTSQQLTIYSDRDGIPVWREPWQTANDQSNSRRNDYFTVQKVKFPTNLSVGKYQLKVRVRDEQSRAESETIIPFVMTAAALNP
ncbi:MAG: hypothetical protein MK089_09945 [Phycisphaerales bacterium]|nr:hypothetical protein [Phycisphaerales bacterium]